MFGCVEAECPYDIKAQSVNDVNLSNPEAHGIECNFESDLYFVFLLLSQTQLHSAQTWK